jgi:stage II sporulation protein D
MRDIRFESQDANEDEVAAALAAVQTYLNDETLRATQAEEVTAKPTWRAARLLEGVNVGRRFDRPMTRELRANPWLARFRVYTMAALGALMIATAANAQGVSSAQHTGAPCPGGGGGSFQNSQAPYHSSSNSALLSGSVGSYSAPVAPARGVIMPSSIPVQSTSVRGGLLPLLAAPEKVRNPVPGSTAVLSASSPSSPPSKIANEFSDALEQVEVIETPDILPGNNGNRGNGNGLGNASGFDNTSGTGNTADGAAPRTVTDNRKTSIRIGLAIGVCSAHISMPDGGRIVELGTGEALAEVPRQSHWTVSASSITLGNRLKLEGRFGNARLSQVFVASRRSKGTYEPVAYTPSIAPVTQQFGEFKRAPEVVRDATPQLSLPLVPFQKKIDAMGLPVTSNFGANGYLIMPPGDDGLVGVNGKLYRGALLVNANAKAPDRFNVINVVDVEDYLLSVVPSEMPSAWPLEALKAQAIAARSYALSNIGKNGSQGFDLRPTIDDQVYGGVQSEQESSNRAVAETRGLVLWHCDKVVSAFFHSTSGGCTETAENVWNRPVPYLKSVPDYDDGSPHFQWTRTIGVGELEAAFSRSKRDVGGLLSMFPIARGSSPRVKMLLVTGTRGTVFISGEQLRGLLKLPSTSFNVGYVDGAYTFAGRGFGHGLGLSQYGAKGLAEQGYNAPNILAHYFKDVSLKPFLQ